MKQEKYIELLAKELSGNASVEERKALKNWRAQNQENEKFAQKSEQLWKMSTTYKDKPFEADVALAWQKVKKKISVTPTLKKGRERSLWLRVARVAAVFLVLVGLFWLWQRNVQMTEGGSPEMALIQTTKGENKRVELPDGSKIWLNENTELSYSLLFEKREVSLSGEAFFEVARMESRPFEILSEGATTRVLGTSFNIRAYPQEEEVKLVVKTGKVAFSGHSDSGKQKVSILTVGEAAIFNKNKKSVSEEKIGDANAFAWQTKILNFEGTRLENVERILENYYGIEIEVKNKKTLSCRFNGGRFEKAELSELLEMLSLALDLQITRDGEKYIVEGEGCS